MADEHDVVARRPELLADDRGVLRTAGRRVVAGQVDRDRVVAAGCQLRHEPFPAPAAVPRTVDEAERRHASDSSSASTSVPAAASAASAPGMSQRDRSSSPTMLEIARSSSAGTSARAAARSTPKPSIASIAASAAERPTPAVVAISTTGASGSARLAAVEQLGRRLDLALQGDRRGEVVVDGAGADHHRADAEPGRVPRAGDADVQHGIRARPRDRRRGGRRRLDRSDAAGQRRRRPADPGELERRRRDHEYLHRASMPSFAP